MEDLIEMIMKGPVPEDIVLQLENLSKDSLIWEGDDIIKSEENQSIESIKRIGETEYIKIDQSWKYYKDDEIEKGARVLSIQEGHELTAPDGTTGKVISNDGKVATLSYVKDGMKKEAQVPSLTLEQRKLKGEIQHNASPTTLQDHHKKYVEEAHAEGKSATHILSRLKEFNVDEDEALEHVTNYRKEVKQKNTPVKPEKEKKEEKPKIETKTTPKPKKNDEPLHHYIHKNWDGKKWNYDYGQHFNGTKHSEENNHSEESEQHVKTKADLITKIKSNIEGLMKGHDSWDKEEKENLKTIESIKNTDGRDSKSTNPMKSQNYKLQSRKQTTLQNVHKLHNNLVTLLER